MSATVKWCKDKSRLAICDKQVFCIDEYGTKYWWLNGLLHRENGPAVEYASGYKYWYLNGKIYSESDYWKEINK